MKRKSVFCVVTVVLFMVLLAACGKTEESGNSDGKITLNMAWWGSQMRHDATVKVIELYQKENPNVSIDYEFYDYEGYYTKLSTLAASNDIWDVFQLDNQFPQYINQIEPLNDFADSGVIDISNTTDTYLATTTYDGKLVGISNGVNSFAIAYNKNIFDELGIDEPSENWTWEEFEQICLKITKELGIYGVSRFDDFIAGSIIQIPQQKKGLNFYDKESLSKKLGFDDPSMLVSYFEMRKKLVESKSYPELGEIGANTDLAFQAVRDKEAAMVLLASNQLSELVTDLPEDMEIKLINPPRAFADGESGIPLRSSQMLSVSQNSKNKEEAAKFVSFFQNDEEANKILNGERGVPIMENIREMLSKDGNETTLATFTYLEEVSNLDNGEINVFDSELNPEIQNQYNLIMDKVIYGEVTPKEAAQSIFDFATNILK